MLLVVSCSSCGVRTHKKEPRKTGSVGLGSRVGSPAPTSLPGLGRLFSSLMVGEVPPTPAAVHTCWVSIHLLHNTPLPVSPSCRSGAGHTTHPHHPNYPCRSLCLWTGLALRPRPTPTTQTTPLRSTLCCPRPPSPSNGGMTSRRCRCARAKFDVMLTRRAGGHAGVHCLFFYGRCEV